jgi:aspartate carbamoyltransferase catalytic subunit
LRADVLYMTRIQRERFDDAVQYERLKGSWLLNREMVGKSGNDSLLMPHRLPRVDEIATGANDLPGAACFRLAHNGAFLCMALPTLLLGRI